MARRSEHTQEEIKAMILEAAETIVDADGFAELKVRKVAMEIGYTVGSIYMVFDNMADLIMHIKGRALDDIAKKLEQVINDGLQAEQTIELLAKTYLNYACQHFNRWNMIFEHRLAENEQVPIWYQQKVDAIFNLVEVQFKRIAKSHTDEQSKQAARALWGGVHGICTLTLSGKLDLLGINNIENTVLLLVENFIKGWKQVT
jgi:AcrR family transcriptional regulator